MGVKNPSKKRSKVAEDSEVPNKVKKVSNDGETLGNEDSTTNRNKSDEGKQSNSEFDNATGVVGSEKNIYNNPDGDNEYNEGQFQDEGDVAEQINTDFKIPEFRKKLKESSFIPDLRHFVILADRKQKIVKKYIEKKGKPLEIAEALERIDKSNVPHVYYVCSALNHVLMEILRNEKEQLESAQDACRYFIRSHGHVTEKLLQSDTLNHRICALKLLTAIVCVEPKLGRQVLSSFDSIQNRRQLRQLLSNRAVQTNSKNGDNVRKSFVHFFLAFLIEGNILLIRNILDKTDLLGALMWGLMGDDHVTLCVIFSTLKKHVLENLYVSKTKKVQIFDMYLQDILKVVYWKGPIIHAVKERNAPEEDKEAVRKVLFEFLEILLTSRKYGVAFDAMNNMKQKRNLLPHKALVFFNSPWVSPFEMDLCIKIIQACPELAKGLIKHCAMSKTFRFMKNELDAIQILNFLDKVVTELEPSVMKSGLEKITLTDYAKWIKELCLSPELLTVLRLKSFIYSESFDIRLGCVRLLLTLFRQYCNYMNAIIEREKLKGGDLRRFRFEMINHVFVNFPTVEMILLSLYESINQQNKTGVNVLEHLECTLDLVLLVRQTYPTFVAKTGRVIDYIKMLKPFYETTSVESNNVRIELKAVKLILLLQPRSLQPGSAIFEDIVKSFLNIFCCSTDDLQKEAADVLKTLLSTTQFFDNGFLEIDLWLEVLKHVDSEIVDRVKQHLVQKFTALGKNKEKIGSELDNRTDCLYTKTKLTDMFKNIEEGIAVQGNVATPTINMFLKYVVQTCGEASPYYDLLTFLMFHYIPMPTAVHQLYGKYFSGYYKYMFSWIGKEKPGKLKVPTIPYFNEMYDSIISGKMNFSEVFAEKDEENAATFVFNENEFKFTKCLQNERMVMIYLYQVTFIVSQLSMNHNLESLISSSASHYASFLLEVLNASRTVDHTVHEVNATEDNKQQSYLEHALKYFYCSHVYMLQDFNLFGSQKSDHNFLSFIAAVTNTVSTFNLNNFDEITAHYRAKIIKQIDSYIGRTIRGESTEGYNTECILNCLEAFKMTNENCIEMLGSLAKLSFDETNITENIRCAFLEILIYNLNRLAELKELKTDNELVVRVGAIYIKLIEISGEVNLDKLEEAFYNFLSIFHHCIPPIPADAFSIVFHENRKITKNSVKLASILLERREDLNEKFMERISDNITKKEILYPLLNVICRKGIEIQPNVAMQLYQEYKNGFMKCVDKPQKAGVIYKENVEISNYLIRNCMPINECTDFSKKSLKFDAVEVYQIQIIETIYGKALESTAEDKETESYSMILVNFLNCLIQMFTCIQKKDSVELTKWETLSYYSYKWIERSKSYNINKTAFEKIVKSSLWNSFCKMCLKVGMQAIDTADDEEKRKIEEYNALLIKTLTYLCDYFYEDGSNEEDAMHIFDMVVTHSRFFDIALVQSKCAIKAQIMRLYYVLINKNKTTLDGKHIPLLLGAYQAKMSETDQFILAILQFYEQNEIDLHEYRPFIWSDSAVAHYSLKNEEEKTAVVQDPSVALVMSLIDKRVSEYTINNFPVWRKLDVSGQLPEISFKDPDPSKLVIGNNKLESYIEAGVENFENHFLNLCPKKYDLFEECYDPAFIIPLMMMSFAPEIYSHPFRAIENGLLGIVFSALSSQDKDMRLAAGCVQLRYRQHFENNKFYDKPLWIQAYDNIQCGLDTLRKSWLNHKKVGVPRPPYIPCLFLAKTFTIIYDPLDPIYKVLIMYLRVKETFNFLSIPEFNVLFYSSEVNHHIFRKFILEVMKDGIKCSSDFFLLVTTNSLRVILSFYNTPISTMEENLLILSLMSTCAKIPSCAKYLIEQVGIISWIHAVVSSVEYYQFDTIEGVISIVNNLWYAARSKKQEFINFNQVETRIFYILVKMCDHMSSRISFNSYSKLVNILTKTAGRNHKCLPETDLDRLINCSQKHFEHHLWCIKNIKANGALCIESDENFRRKLKTSSLSDKAIFTLASLRQFVVKWVS